MRQRQLGSSSFQLTTIGIGTWAIGGGDWKFGWGQQDEHEAVAAVVAGVRSGINWIDTAAVYGNGRSEELVGRALRQLNADERPIVATKCGRIIQDDGNVVGRLDPDSVVAECEASLRRLGVDCIDLYQIHWPDPLDQIEAAWETLHRLKQAGKIREMGVSNHSVAQMERLQRLHPITSLQPPYSLLARDIEAEILPYCARQHIGVICYSPLAKGLLSGAFDRQRAASLPADDHRSRDVRFQEPLLSRHLAFVDQLQKIAAASRYSVAELAIAWTLRRPEVTSAIVGARRPSQIEALVAAGDWELSSSEREAITCLIESALAS